MKKFWLIIAAVISIFTFFSEVEAAEKVKVGFIFLHDENSTYDLNFIVAAEDSCKVSGAEYVFKKMCLKLKNVMKLQSNW